MARGDGAISKLPLDKIVKSYCISEHYFLYENMYSAHILPISSFPTKSEMETFENNLQNEPIRG
jgi:hypothetical protein